MLNPLIIIPSGRSAAWLARRVRDAEVGGSNPLAPTIITQIEDSRQQFLHRGVWKFGVLTNVARKDYYDGTIHTAQGEHRGLMVTVEYDE